MAAETKGLPSSLLLSRTRTFIRPRELTALRSLPASALGPQPRSATSRPRQSRPSALGAACAPSTTSVLTAAKGRRSRSITSLEESQASVSSAGTAMTTRSQLPAAAPTVVLRATFPASALQRLRSRSPRTHRLLASRPTERPAARPLVASPLRPRPLLPTSVHLHPASALLPRRRLHRHLSLCTRLPATRNPHRASVALLTRRT